MHIAKHFYRKPNQTKKNLNKDYKFNRDLGLSKESDLVGATKVLITKCEAKLKQYLLAIAKELHSRIEREQLPIKIYIPLQRADTTILYSYIKQYNKHFVAKTAIRLRVGVPTPTRIVGHVNCYSGANYAFIQPLFKCRYAISKIDDDSDKIKESTVSRAVDIILSTHQKESVEIAYRELDKFAALGQHIEKGLFISGNTPPTTYFGSRHYYRDNKYLSVGWSKLYANKISEVLKCDLKMLTRDQAVELINLVHTWYKDNKVNSPISTGLRAPQQEEGKGWHENLEKFIKEYEERSGSSANTVRDHLDESLGILDARTDESIV